MNLMYNGTAAAPVFPQMPTEQQHELYQSRWFQFTLMT